MPESLANEDFLLYLQISDSKFLEILYDIQAFATGGSGDFSQKRIFSAGAGRFAKTFGEDRYCAV